MWWNLILYTTAALFLAMTLAALWNFQWMRRLPILTGSAGVSPASVTGSAGISPASDAGSASVSPAAIRCSVVIAGRNEASRIEQTIRCLLAQRGVAIQLIVVDDRSTDQTPAILRQLAAEDARLKVIRVDALPDGWLGKCHACHVGASTATGDWILFTDADCWLKPDVILRALLVAQREQVAHVTLAPGTVAVTLGAKAWHLMFLISLANWFSGVNRDRPKAHLGIGAFNLVRADAYRQCGGYQALRLTVVDDIKLGLLLRRAGHRTRGFLGAQDVECHWGATVADMVRIMEKNYFAVLDYRLGLALAGSLFTLVILGILTAGLVGQTTAGLIAALSPLTLILPAAILARRIGWNWTSAILAPFMLPVFLYALLNSIYATLRHGGIRWRDTFYPLATLRAGNVQ